jgi:ribosome biogenesis GTPase A
MQPRRGDLRTIFQAEPRAVIEARKRDAPRPLVYATDRGDSQSIYTACGVHEPRNQPRIFCKPRWSRAMSPEELSEVEDAAYAEWLAAVEQEAQERGDDAKLNLFERNIEVWRELWRVLERSRVLVHLADVRCPLLHISDRLIEHVAALQPRKALVIVLTKTDLVSDARVRAWAEYLRARYELQVVAYNRDDISGSNAALLSAIGHASQELDGIDGGGADNAVEGDEEPQSPLTFGLVGEPNVGKSSLLNNLFGRKLVSVSATPGHTKHWQTHFLDGVEELLLPERGDDGAPRRRVLVCDCPGVVFPRVNVPLSLQILFGSFPIAQTREPFSAIRFLAENCAPPLHEIYKLRPVDDDEPEAGMSRAALAGMCFWLLL